MGTAVAPVAERELGLATDHDLVAAVRRGEDRAFEKLYERYQRRIAAYVYGMVNDYGRAEDITQEVFISALRRMRETERPIAFKPWIYEIAKNACIDQFRRSRRAEEVSFDADEGAGALETSRLSSPDATPDVAVDNKQQLSNLCGAFGGLSETHHQILVLRELEGLSYREIGEKMGLSRPSVESTLFRARRRLTEEYDELISGERCNRIQVIITAAGEGMLGTRDQRRLAKHVAHCQPCRREARLAGLDSALLGRTVPQTVAAKVAALLPFPGFWFKGRTKETIASASGNQGSNLSQWSSFASMAEPLAGWTKAAVAAATLLVAGTGAGVATKELTSDPSGDTPKVTDAKPASSAAKPAATKQTAGTRATTSRPSALARKGSGSGSVGEASPVTSGGSTTSTSGTSTGAAAPVAGEPEKAPPIPPDPQAIVEDPPSAPSNGDDPTKIDPVVTGPPADPLASAEQEANKLNGELGGAVGTLRDELGE